MKFLFVLFMFLLSFSLHASEIESYFSPSLDCEKHIADYIDQTRESLDIMIYSFTNQRILDAIYRAFDRGVKIRVIADRVQSSGKHSKIFEMYQKGIPVRIKNGSGIMHNKIAIFDHKRYVTGSYNWTDNASLRNDENCQFVHDNPETLKQYEDKMNELWNKYSTEKNDPRFLKRSDNGLSGAICSSFSFFYVIPRTTCRPSRDLFPMLKQDLLLK